MRNLAELIADNYNFCSRDRNMWHDDCCSWAWTSCGSRGSQRAGRMLMSHILAYTRWRCAKKVWKLLKIMDAYYILRAQKVGRRRWVTLRSVFGGVSFVCYEIYAPHRELDSPWATCLLFSPIFSQKYVGRTILSTSFISLCATEPLHTLARTLASV